MQRFAMFHVVPRDRRTCSAVVDDRNTIVVVSCTFQRQKLTGTVSVRWGRWAGTARACWRLHDPAMLEELAALVGRLLAW